MKDPHALEDEEGSFTNTPSSVLPPTTIPSSPPLVPTTTRPNFTSDTAMETKAVSMASNSCGSTLSSPAEASPAKPAVAPPTAFDGTIETSPATSHIASASDSLTCTGVSVVNVTESAPSLPELPSTTFGSPDQETDFPAVLTFKGVTVTLENNSVWKQFFSCGTEMILTKQGRRMFPYCRYRLSGLDPERQYSLVLSIVPTDQYRYRWSTSRWEVTGPAEHQAQGLIRAFSHHYSPCRGAHWMSGQMSFYKLKLTNNSLDQEGHIILHSMHRYIPRLHVIPVPDGVVPTPDQPVVMGPESMTFTFPQTEFMAVTTYQNFRITQLKINHNPFAKGFREDGNNPRLTRVTTEASPLVKMDAQPYTLKSVELKESKEEVVDLSTKNHTVSASLSSVQATRLVLKPIMSTTAGKDEPYVPCIRGKHALGELVLVQKRPCLEPKEETVAVSVTPKAQQGFRQILPKAISTTPTSTTPTTGSSPGYRKRGKRINRRWASSRGKEWKAAADSPTVVHSPSFTVTMQPELDDVEGLLFVSFTSKEALEVHVRDKPAKSTSSASPVSLMSPVQMKQTMEVIPETEEEKITRLEAILLQDIHVLKHRHVIHPVLQEVGLKLSSLDPTKSIDLQYLGVQLPLPPPNLPEEGNAMSPGDEGLPFISRTGKTSDMTKIKGWKNKFIRNKETSPPHCDGSQKNLSAFCSNMLDEYLESEAQYISERAAAFSSNSAGSVAYQLPAKSSSYVKTLDSVLKHRNAASTVPVAANRPCPLSHKPLLYSALMSPAPPLASLEPPGQAGAQSILQCASSSAQPGPVLAVNAAPGSSYTSSVSERLITQHIGVSQRSALSFGQSQGMTHRPPGLTKFQLKMLQMEIGAQNEGLSRTQLTQDRLSMALSVMLTKQMQANQVLKVSRYPKYKPEGPECGRDFCRLGCVCSSLQHLNRGPLHCRRPECMFGCACFKRKITKQNAAGESEQQIQPVYSVTNMEHVVPPHPGSHVNKLWNHGIYDVDPEPTFAPKSAALSSVPSKILKRSSVSRLTQPIEEEDKDPVYKYLESMMTCARVREFNSKPPPVVTIEPKIVSTSTPNTTAKPEKTTTDDLPKKYYRTIMTVKKAENSSQGTTSDETVSKKQIQIQSACQWDKDHKMVLETLCRRMNQNRLCQTFCIGPYCIRPVAKIFMQKPSGSIITYRVHISKPSKASDVDEDEFDESDEERHANKSLDGDIDPEEEDGQIEEPEMQFGVTPFLSGVLPAGRLRARTKPVGCLAYGLIQVNGKSYNQARLLLGNMGSLHPANRLAAYVTGRLHAPADISHKNSQKSDPTNKINTPGPLHIKAAGSVVPAIITARKTTELKTPTQPPVQLPQPDSWRKGSINLPQHSQNHSTISPVQTFASGQRSSVNLFQNSSTSSPVSLTVSQSLKTPSFLGQSGTYSFRICPPANQGTRDQNLPGVTLPGGFTLIQLPKPGANGAVQQSKSENVTNMAGVDKASPPREPLFHFGNLAADSPANLLGLHTFMRAKELLSSKSLEPRSFSELMCHEKMPTEETDEANNRQMESNLDIASEDLSSDSSDYGGEGDEDEEIVDIETVEEVGQGKAIAIMKEAVRKASQESRDSSDDLGSARELCIQDETGGKLGESKDKRRRKNHSVLERQRRCEQKALFIKLQNVLKSDPRAPRLTLLSLANKEIQNLVESSKRLEETKRRLIKMQALYVKELSLLSGKSDTLIKHKLKEICDRQKMREKTMKWKPFFSNLLQSRAALLQAITPQSKLQPTPLLQPDLDMAPSLANPHTAAAQNSIDKTPKPTPQSRLQAVFSSPAQAEFTAPSSQATNQPVEPAASVQHELMFKGQQKVPEDGASPTSSTPNSNPSQPFTLPLIRTKTGRIILPSSLRPIGQGFYTLMVLNPKQKEEEGEVNMQPSDADSSKKREKSFSKSEHPSSSENSCVLEEDKTAQPSNSEPKRSGVNPPLAELALLNQSIFGPSSAPQAVENSQECGAGVGVNKTRAAACLSFNRVGQIPTSVKPEPDESPPVVRRSRGRPRKQSVTPVSEKVKHTAVEDTSKSVSESVTSILVRKRRSEKIALEVTKTRAEKTPVMVRDNPVAAKRGRGRPPKNNNNKLVELWSPPIMPAGRGRSKSNKNTPFRLTPIFKSPDTRPKGSPATTTRLGDVNTFRPLTRGALGKDFPSAKRRSWIDIEKELEPELESESE
ncbi:MAX gene-associated protein-like isoform X2 [Morone saxatilis]|uniref:MAX gene-associated protein-like isoform X2 n=1 Tax=Morone saxatilis TaxID=34816 RepID=UPI0015E236EB|nr:MAX gene-associated protein-like isoform X2 [Morone saxatilis]